MIDERRFPGRQGRLLFAYLVVEQGRPVPRGELAEALWGQAVPATWDKALTVLVSKLRGLLAAHGIDSALTGAFGCYRLYLPEGSWVDVIVAVNEAGEAEKALAAGDVAKAKAAASQAASLTRTPFLPGEDGAWVEAKRRELADAHVRAVATMADACLRSGEAAEAAKWADQAIALDTFRESGYRCLMAAHIAAGNRAEALRVYERCRRLLAEELGTYPSPETESLYRELLNVAPAPRLLAQDSGLPCPYRGLARYETGDAELFVGRERLVDELVARLVDERLLVVVGPSGAGKSSLVRAGLLPALAAGALPGSGAWSVRVIQPGTEPLDVLTTALTGLPNVLVVDQAEEALLADEGSGLVPFGDRVLAAADAGTRIVLVLRADFYGLLAGHPALARYAGPATVLVGPPGERELRRIITEPATGVGLRVDPALADLIVAEVRDRPGVLPVLSTALVRTWEHRDGDLLSVASYRAGGGVAAALQRAGEEAWAALADDAQRGACRRMLLRLAADEDGSWVRHWARRAELVRPDDAPAAAALAVLTGHRLVVARADDLGVAHEALLTGWPRLHGWLEDGRSRAAVRERLAAAATEWEEADRDPAELYRGTRLQAALDTAAASPEELTPLERAFLAESADEADRQLAEQRARADREARGRRRARLVAAGLAVAFAFAASAGGYAIVKQRQADARQRQAQRAALAADASRLGALARAGGDYDKSLLLAAQAVKLNPSPSTESDLFATLLHGDAVVATLRGPQAIQSAVFSLDGSAVFAVDSAGHLLRWSTLGGPVQTVRALGHEASEITVAADGRLVVSYRSSKNVRTLGVLDPTGAQLLAQIPNVQPNYPWQGGFALAQDRRDVVFLPASEDTPSSIVRIWRIGAPRSAIRQVNVGGPVHRVAACGPGTACAFTNDRHIVRIRLSDATIEGRVTLPPDTLEVSAASPDGRMVAIARPDGVIRLIDARTGAVRQVLGGAFRDPHPLAFSLDGHEVVVADFDSLLVWRVGRDGLPERHDVFGGQITFATWSRDGSTLAGGGLGGTVVLLDRTGRRRVGAVVTDALGDDTSTLWAVPGAIVAGQSGGKVVFVDPSSGAVHAVDGPVRDPAHLPLWMRLIESARAGGDGRLVVTTNLGGDTAVWDVASQRLLGTVALPAPPHFDRNTVPLYDPSAWVSPDGRQAATIRSHAGPIVFDPVTRRVLRHLPPLPGPAGEFEVAVQGWTPDGHSILVTRRLSAAYSELLVIDATTGAVKLRVGTGAAGASEAAEDPAGRFIALAMRDGMLQILDAKGGHALAPPQRANDGAVLNVSISPDGRYIATGGEPPRLTVWDTQTFRQVAIPLPLDVNANVARTRFAPDGRLVVASGSTLRAFTIDPAAWQARACQETRRTLTPAEFEEVLPGRPYRPACA